MTDSTRDKWRILCRELGFNNGASFATALQQIKMLRQARDREITLRGHVKQMLEHVRYDDRGKVRCALCKGEYWGKHAGGCVVNELRRIVAQ